MSRWDDQFNSHAVNTSLSNLFERLEDNALESQDPEVIDLVDKIKQMANYCETCLQNTIPQLVTAGQLKGLNNQIQNVLSELNSYISAKDISHLNNASSHVDATMTQINAFPIPRQQLSEEGFTKSLLAFKATIEGAYNDIQTTKDALATQLTKMTDETRSNQGAIQKTLTKIKTLDSNIDTKEQQFQQTLESNLANNKKKFEATVSGYETTFTGLITELKSNAQVIIETLEQNKKSASDLVQIIGNIGITGNYQKIANEERDSANNWRNIALTLMIGMVLVIGTIIGLSVSEGFDWKLALFRIGTALVLVIPATYAARESSRHRSLESYNRRAELELASLGPFLEKLPEDTKIKLKEQLTGKFFGMNMPQEGSNENLSANALIDLLKLAISKKNP
jgi:hypothetical protein